MAPSIGSVRKRLGSLPAGILMGALCGAIVGGVIGRLYMRLIFLLNPDRDGAQTDFGDAGQITLGGSLDLVMVSTVAGVIGGMLYVGVRRWLPDRTTTSRGVVFGLFMSFGPGLVFLSPVDLNIFEPALPIYLGFVALIVLYGVGVSMLTDRVSPPAAKRDRSRRSRRVVAVAVATGVVLALLALNAVVVAVEDAGTCLSGDGTGGCGTPAKK